MKNLDASAYYAAREVNERARPTEPRPHPMAAAGTCWGCGGPFWISYTMLEWTDRYCRECRGASSPGPPERAG